MYTTSLCFTSFLIPFLVSANVLHTGSTSAPNKKSYRKKYVGQPRIHHSIFKVQTSNKLSPNHLARIDPQTLTHL